MVVDRYTEILSLNGALQAAKKPEWIKGGHWKAESLTIATTPHYHSNTHDAYAILQGKAGYILGKSPLDPDADADGNPVGVRLAVHDGDVFVFPAGVMHSLVDMEWDYEIVVFYSLNERNYRDGPYDMEYGLDSMEKTVQMRKKCEQVPVPIHDPLYGKDGPMPRIWESG